MFLYNDCVINKVLIKCKNANKKFANFGHVGVWDLEKTFKDNILFNKKLFWNFKFDCLLAKGDEERRCLFFPFFFFRFRFLQFLSLHLFELLRPSLFFFLFLFFPFFFLFLFLLCLCLVRFFLVGARTAEVDVTVETGKKKFILIHFANTGKTNDNPACANC